MPWPWQACQFLIHLHLFIQLTFQRCQKVWGMFYWDIIWGSNLEFGLVKTTSVRAIFLKKYCRGWKVLWSCWQNVKNRKKLISFDTSRKDTLHKRKTVLIHHLSSKVNLCTVIYICAQKYTLSVCKLYLSTSLNCSNQRGQIMSTTLLIAPPDLKT